MVDAHRSAINMHLHFSESEANMNTKNRKRCLIGMSCLALMTMLWLAGCAPRGGIISWSPVPTPIGAATIQRGPQPEPTRADGITPRSNGISVTPLPSEKVRLGVLSELVLAPQALATPNSQRYRTQELIKGDGFNRTSVIAVSDTQSGREIARFDDDTSRSVFMGMNDEYVIWWCGACKSLKMGLYAYRIATSEQVLITEKVGQYPKIDGEWVVYIADVQDSHAELRAHSLTTGEDILITQDMATRGYSVQGPGSWGDFFAVRDGRVVWATSLSASNAPPNWGLDVYDLTKRTTHTLNLPENLGNFSHLDIHGDTVLWRTDFWQGYDLNQDAYFSIPMFPPGWENIQIEKIGPVVASQGRLYWSLTANGKEHYFTAPIVPRN
jgi:hypothetical protein